MRNLRRLISKIENCSDNYKSGLREIGLELSDDSIKYAVHLEHYKVEDTFRIKGLFQRLRLKRIAEKTSQYFASKGIDAYTCSSTSCDDSF